ncbi:hypothetical protein I0C86_32840 [Plantactinospora sp. S1510]|uniref:DUF998 domain-containing protein n=1 Tax=Plantactinospora alkalitolerans TaxID=2789879 RepID=A0ABS0H5F0_9ACTN|nr:hypothetical protein [Plantactinospora alkalitolerans]MBF9133687.1 hypothetical protein [Plantactinospora alkalitolerans]
MTPTALRRAARICLVILVFAAFAAFTASWFTRANGDTLNGLDLGYLASELNDQPYPVAQFFTEASQLPAVLAILLAPGVAVRSLWGRIVAVLLGLLATMMAVVVLMVVHGRIEDYWEPAWTQRYQLFAVVVGLIAVLVLGAVVTLALGRRQVYGVAVALLLVGSAAFNFYSVAVLSWLGSIDVEVSPVAWAPGPAWLLAAGCALVAVWADAAAGRASGAGGGHPDRAEFELRERPTAGPGVAGTHGAYGAHQG